VSLLLAAYALVFAPLRAAMKAAMPGGAPLLVRRALVALERRLPFGAGRVKNAHAPDVVFTAAKPA
jgi:hypothetical protein